MEQLRLDRRTTVGPSWGDENHSVTVTLTDDQVATVTGREHT